LLVDDGATRIVERERTIGARPLAEVACSAPVCVALRGVYAGNADFLPLGVKAFQGARGAYLYASIAEIAVIVLEAQHGRARDKKAVGDGREFYDAVGARRTASIAL
jgi:hypothetical protein